MIVMHFWANAEYYRSYRCPAAILQCMFAIVGFLFGTIIGSFLNVVILRHGAKGIGGRSECGSCGRQLTWADLIPVISWIYLCGRCRSCGSRISIQYPLVELLTGSMFAVLAGAPLPILALLCALAVAAILIAIGVYDLRHTIIPDEWAILFALFALAYAYVTGAFAIAPINELLAGPIAAAPFFFLWAISRGAWMGLGDAKLALGVGWLLGIAGGIEAVFLGFMVGAVISVCILLPLPYLVRVFNRRAASVTPNRFTMKSEVPFGPFLVAGTWIVWVLTIYGLNMPIIL